MIFDYCKNYIVKNKSKYFLLTILLSLGISIYLCVRTFNQIIVDGHKSSSIEISGNDFFKITSNTGRVDQSLYKTLYLHNDVKFISPINTKTVLINNKKRRLIGIDILSSGENINFREEDKTLVFSASNEDITNINIDGVSHSVAYRHLGKSSNFQNIKDSIYIDIAKFQSLSNSNYVESFLLSTSKPDLIKKLIGNGHILESASGSGKANSKITKAMRTNLNFFAFLTLLLTSAIVFNVLNFLITKRQKDFGILRSLGASQINIRKIIIYELAIIQGISLLIGLSLGYLLCSLSSVILGDVMSTIYSLNLSRFSFFKIEIIIETFIISSLILFIVYLFLALKASKLAIINSLNSQYIENQFSRHSTAFILLSVITTTVAIFFYIYPLQSLKLSIIPPALSILGIAFIIPLALGLLKYLPLNAKIAFACDELSSKPRTYMFSILTVSISLSLVISVGTLIYSFQGTVVNWTNKVLQGDFFLSMSEDMMKDVDIFFSELSVKEISDINGAQKLESAIYAQLYMEDVPVTVISSTTDSQFSNLVILKGKVPTNDNEIIVSEAYSKRNSINIGGAVEIKGADYSVTAINQDYKSEFGTIRIFFNKFKKIFGKTRPNVLSLTASEEASLSSIEEDLKLLQKKYKFSYAKNTELKNQVLNTFNQTFSLTKNILLIAFIISLVNILSNLQMMQVEQVKNIQILKSIGASNKVVREMLRYQAVIVTLISIFFGLLIGYYLALYLTNVIHQKFFGWGNKF